MTLAMGRWGERLAADYLVGIGAEVLERNFRTQYAEAGASSSETKGRTR
jgi:Holliday junction resolvase-like predicted endonuclease